MSSVPNIIGIKLSEVTAVVSGSSLNTAFANSVDRCFNSAYKGNKDRLSNFRDYDTMRGALSIGDAYKGGLITYIYQSGDAGYVAGEQHGLIAFLWDLQYNNSNLKWQITNSYLGVTDTGFGDGTYNSSVIYTLSPDDYTAARLCETWAYGNYYDWFLPSRDELVKLKNLSDIGLGNISLGSFYWSSSEWDFSRAWAFYINSDPSPSYTQQINKDTLRCVRPFRAF
jgi:hypothetical protein